MTTASEFPDETDAHVALRTSENPEDPKRLEAELCARERELSQLVDMVPSHLWRLTPDGEPTFFNRRMVDFLGLTVEDTDQPGKSRLAAMIDASVHPDDARSFGDELRRCLACGDPFAMKYRLRRTDGAYRWMSSRAEPMRDPAGQIVQWYGLCHDIDDQVRTEEALRHQEQQLRQMIDAVPVRAFSTTPTGDTVHFNKRYEDYLRSVVPDFETIEEPRIWRLVASLLHPEDAPEVQAKVRHCFATGETFTMRYRRRDPEGVYRWTESRMEPLRDADGAIVQWYSINLDVDDEVRAREALLRASEQLAQASRAASLAELSASIAHEVNQPLAAIVSNSHACHRWLSAEPPNLERAVSACERITRDANSAAEVVERIRGLFRRAPPPRSSEDINALIREVCQLMADELKAKDARFETELESQLPPIALDRVQVQQVLVNLIRNGVEAMDSLVDRPRALRIRSLLDGHAAIRVEVRDSGLGISDPERVFEPFFTTKPHGMGMGLAICRSIVESHGGKLWMANQESRGAVASFTLPLAGS